ncbi:MULTISPECIES: AcvB/VirJ family lysyl-phosphatidylglycerol hydrolase [Dyella]|uniref:Alpha/beta hydrolase n=2 Tax=Dyella TaxID=231454 RepID=A0A4R0YYN5_9GAMM|nr:MULTISPECIES: AcvB/VirJ family lysyl-phosphatidylglycerol hydrolase [Dyella]TBR40271.1 alpha/beta hydrolase [Dyella terrae]TCI12148.1 alpha/beta hydrolase [Dyella soli]
MKRVFKWVLVVWLLLILAGLLAWHPWHHASMDDSLVVLPAKEGVTPAAGREDVLTVFYSGDGGWRDLDKTMGGILADHGMPVLGVSLLKYYWRDRSPEASAADLDALIKRYGDQLGKKRVWLIGFSFGADVLPSVVDRLPPETRARIAQVVLLSPSKDVNFEIEMQGYMVEGWWKTQTQNLMQSINPVHHYDALPPLLALGGKPPVICYYGKEDEDDTICARTDLPSWITVHVKKGDHHFDYDYEGLARQMIEELPASTTATP